jgi:hypothetical protein
MKVEGTIEVSDELIKELRLEEISNNGVVFTHWKGFKLYLWSHTDEAFHVGIKVE